MKKKALNRKTIILIPNATNPRNIGDRAILEGQLLLIVKNFIKPDCIIHSTEHKKYTKLEISKYKIKPTLYSWSVFEKKGSLIRVFRLIQLFTSIFFLKFNLKLRFIPDNFGLKKILNDYKKADLIFLAGGGYLRAKTGITQGLNLIMQCIPIYIAQILKKKVFVGAISFGPFAYDWQKKLTQNSLKYADIVAARESISYKLLISLGLKNVILTSDFAFLVKKIKINKHKENKSVIGLTLREWFNNLKQMEFENQIVLALKKLSQVISFEIQPIVQVNSPAYGDNDKYIATRISEKLKKENIKVRKVLIPENINDAQKYYGKLDALIGMRMHSNILTSIQLKPFLAISYEHKTLGISMDLKTEEFCIKSESLNKNNLFKLSLKLLRHKKSITRLLENSVYRIKFRDTERWTKIFNNYN